MQWIPEYVCLSRIFLWHTVARLYKIEKGKQFIWPSTLLRARRVGHYFLRGFLLPQFSQFIVVLYKF